MTAGGTTLFARAITRSYFDPGGGPAGLSGAMEFEISVCDTHFLVPSLWTTRGRAGLAGALTFGWLLGASVNSSAPQNRLSICRRRSSP